MRRCIGCGGANNREFGYERWESLTGGGELTLAMAVSIGWGVFLLMVVVLGWLVARHNR
jgi:hypothetical protein